MKVDSRAAASAAEAGEVFAALADPTRWQVLALLTDCGEGMATTLTAELPISRPAVIKHLNVLDRAGLVHGRLAGHDRTLQRLPATGWMPPRTNYLGACRVAVERS